MERSIRKSINSDHFNSLFQDSQEGLRDKANVVSQVFEENITFENPEVYLLKESIKTIGQLKSIISTLSISEDLKEIIENLFYVDKDLSLRNDLREKLLDNTKIAFFIGAGVSKLINIPLWDDLANRAIDYLREKQYINHAETSKLKSDIVNPKQKLTIFHRIVKDEKELANFYSENLKEKVVYRENPYELLWSLENLLNKSVLKISTNLDKGWIKLLEDKEKKDKASVNEDGKPISKSKSYSVKIDGFNKVDPINLDCLYQIHGSVDKIPGAIITTKNYVSAYRDDQGLKGFLEKIFKEYVVIFIGSGMQEFEILEHCLEVSPNRHYCLVESFIEEHSLFRVKRKYFETLNVVAVPYYLDFQGYERLLFVLKSWIEEIHSTRKVGYYEALKTIDEALAADE